MKFKVIGGKKLKGVISVSGSKNGSLPLISASLLLKNGASLFNVPNITDIHKTLQIIEKLGVNYTFKNNTIELPTNQFTDYVIDSQLAQQIRASIIIATPVLLSRGRVRFPHPGGDVIGARPIDLFIKGFKSFGAQVHAKGQYYEIVLSKRPKAIKFVFPIVSVGATEAFMMMASKAVGETKLINAAMEPEIIMLADFLNMAGARISGAGTPYITINGVAELGRQHVKFVNIPDRIEAGSYVVMAAASRNNIKIKGLNPNHLLALLEILRTSGVNLKIGSDFVEVKVSKKLKPLAIKTHEYPGLATDLQSPLVVLATQAEGLSLIHETIFEGRMFWTESLKKMGANILPLDPYRIAIQGPIRLKSAEIESMDIRSGVAFVIAAIMADGTSTIAGAEKIDRGYEDFENKLKSIGVSISRLT